MRPYQQPHLPIWYASGNLETISWMAKNGIHTSHIFDTDAVTKKHFDLYQELLENHKGDPDRINDGAEEPKQGQTCHVYIAPTDAEAIEQARTAWKAWCDNINYLWNVGNSDFLKWLYDFDALLADDKIIAGDGQREGLAGGRRVEHQLFHRRLCLGQHTPRKLDAFHEVFRRRGHAQRLADVDAPDYLGACRI